MLFLLSSLITILAISLIFKDKTLPAYIGVFASFVILNGSDILLGIIGVAITFVLGTTTFCIIYMIGVLRLPVEIK